MKQETKIKTTSLSDIIEKIIENPDMFYTKIADELLPEEKIFIIHNLTNRNCGNCTNGCCSLETAEKIGLDENGLPQGSNCIGWYNARLIGKSKILQISDNYQL